MSIVPTLEAFPWERVRSELRSLPRTRVSKRRLVQELVQGDQCFCIRASLEDVLQVLEWWYVAIESLFEKMRHDSRILDFSADIFGNKPRIEVKTFYYAPVYSLRVQLSHEGQSSSIPLGEAAIVRRAAEMYEACLTNLDCLRGWVRFLAGDFSADEVMILSDDDCGEIQIRGGRIIFFEDE
ncbi:MAG: hypothetical protein N2554_05540 [Fimbriimonadales bacterium]|nr:hypothetical protein [Fimbriimonadales bacterium]